MLGILSAALILAVSAYILLACLTVGPAFDDFIAGRISIGWLISGWTILLFLGLAFSGVCLAGIEYIKTIKSLKQKMLFWQKLESGDKSVSDDLKDLYKTYRFCLSVLAKKEENVAWVKRYTENIRQQIESFMSKK